MPASKLACCPAPLKRHVEAVKTLRHLLQRPGCPWQFDLCRSPPMLRFKTPDYGLKR